MKIGDLVKYCGNKHLHIIVKRSIVLVTVQNITTGKKSSLPLHWLTKVETDNF